MSYIQKPFARWETFDECKLEQMEIGHSEESARKICGSIQERAEKGQLFKSLPDLEILKGRDDDLIIGGYASWEIVDAENDYVTTEAMVNFLAKFFNLPVEYRNVSVDHTNFQLATALLKYEGRDETFYSHVHEKGMYLVSKVRNDSFKRTKQLRRLVREGVYKAYSISGHATRWEPSEEHGHPVRKIFDIDPYEVAVVKEGMNQKAAMQVLKRKPFNVRVEKETMRKLNKNLTVEELKLKIAELEEKRTELYRLQEPIRAEEYSKHEVEITGLNAEISALQELLTEKLKLQIEAASEKPMEKKRNLTLHQETVAIFRKHFPDHGDEI